MNFLNYLSNYYILDISFVVFFTFPLYFSQFTKLLNLYYLLITLNPKKQNTYMTKKDLLVNLYLTILSPKNMNLKDSTDIFVTTYAQNHKKKGTKLNSKLF